MANLWRSRLQWFGSDFDGSYEIEQLATDGVTWNSVGSTNNVGVQYYSYETPVLSDATVASFRISKRNIRGEVSGYIQFDELMVRNPSPPSYDVEYDNVDEITVVART